jgi:hypothetical protein
MSTQNRCEKVSGRLDVISWSDAYTVFRLTRPEIGLSDPSMRLWARFLENKKRKRHGYEYMYQLPNTLIRP